MQSPFANGCVESGNVYHGRFFLGLEYRPQSAEQHQDCKQCVCAKNCDLFYEESHTPSKRLCQSAMVCTTPVQDSQCNAYRFLLGSRAWPYFPSSPMTPRTGSVARGQEPTPRVSRVSAWPIRISNVTVHTRYGTAAVPSNALIAVDELDHAEEQ